MSIDGKVINSICVGTDPRNPYISMSSEVQMNLTWKVQIVGNWSETFDHVIDCQVLEIIFSCCKILPVSYKLDEKKIFVLPCQNFLLEIMNTCF